MLGILNYFHNNTLFLIDNVIRLYFDLPFSTFFVVTFIMLFIGIPLITFLYFLFIIEAYIIINDLKYFFTVNELQYRLRFALCVIVAAIGFYIMIYSIVYRFTSAEFFQTITPPENVEQQQQQQQFDDQNQDFFIEPESMHPNNVNNSRNRRSPETYRERRDRRPPRFRTSRVIFQGMENHSEETQRHIAELYYKYLLHYNDSKINNKNGINKFKREIIYRYGRDHYDPKVITTFRRNRNSILEQDYTQYMLVKNRYLISEYKQRIPKLQEIIRSKIRVYGTPEMQADLSLIDDHLKHINNKNEINLEKNKNRKRN